MRAFILFINFCLYGIFLFFQQYAIAAENIVKTAPITNNGKKWRIGYSETGNYYEFNGILKGVVEGLMQLGWIERDILPKNIDNDSNSIWQYIAKNTKSNYLEFVSDAYWSDSLDDEIRKNNAYFYEKIKDIDLVITMGERAAKEVSQVSHKIKIMAMSSTDPVALGIVKGVEFSKISNIHAHVEPEIHKKQVSFFYQELKFKKLGVVYFDDEHGMLFSGIKDIREISNKYNFELIECLIKNSEKVNHSNGKFIKKITTKSPVNSPEWQEAIDKIVEECHENLAPEVDAVYITAYLDVKEKNIEKIIRPLLKYKRPTWASLGMDWDMVQHGVLMSFNRRDYTDIGLFEAKVMAQIFNGSQPGEISQIFHYPKNESILLNLKTAKLIQFNPSWNVLAAAARIYDEIEPSIEKEEQDNGQ